MITHRHAACLLAAASMAACGHEPSATPGLTPVRIETVGSAGVAGAARYSAALLPASRVDLAFRVPGYVAEISHVGDGNGRRRPLQEGDHVTRGQVLTRLRADDYDSRVSQAQSQRPECTRRFVPDEPDERCRAQTAR
jgi:multidrug efflux system membrane fusion protein